MSHNVGEQPTRRARGNLLTWLFSFWTRHRRLLLVALIAVTLVAFLAALSPITRRSILVGLLAQRSVVILLLVFTLTTLSLLWSAGQRLDAWFFTLLNLRGYRPLWLDRIMWAATQVGNGAVGLFLCILLYFINYRRFAVQMLLGILSVWLAVELVKAIVERSRPFLVLQGTRIVGWKERGKSFPSGHTAQAFFIITMLVSYFNFPSPVNGLLYFVAVLVALTRIYVGAHYPRDVIAGAVLGGVGGIVMGLIDIYLTTGLW